MLIIDWSSDVCSSDLLDQLLESRLEAAAAKGELWPHITPAIGAHAAQAMLHSLAIRVRAGESDADLRKLIASAITLIARQQAFAEIGRASCRERVGQYV